jgi:hypothetical protein
MKTKNIANLLLILGMYLIVTPNANAQFFKKLKQRAKESIERTVERKVEEKSEQKTEEVIDSIFTIGKKKKKKKRKGKSGNSKGDNEMMEGMDDGMNTDGEMGMEDGAEEKVSFEAYSKFDFIPGETIIAAEDFAQDEIGDLPARWNTNTSVEVVSLSTQEGKWMRLGMGTGSYVADFINEIPDNFTLEFDVIFDYEPTAWAYGRKIGVLLSDLENPNYKLTSSQVGKNFFRFNLVHDA